ncbi:hypothetical protein EQG49_00395 [Periweissella cryptocerci]|uniref:Uncharacterized protein n=1 Tax=Periweissella cryptocerci TaxID=2506420 RepID=A0A4P6YQZ6_9LACO|nr:hypothetical protein [Periweissella cryptocerci]QBO35013.1 hypothetical protein EQG49_00395 [Periweissella cryptocerci]
MKKIMNFTILMTVAVLTFGLGTASVSAATQTSTPVGQQSKLPKKWSRTVPKKLRGDWYVNIAGTKKYAKFKIRKNSMHLNIVSGTTSYTVMEVPKKYLGIYKSSKNTYTFNSLNSAGEPTSEGVGVKYTTKKINGKKYKALGVSVDVTPPDYYIKKKVIPKISNKVPNRMKGTWYNTDGGVDMKLKGNTVTFGTSSYKAYFTWGNFGTIYMHIGKIGSLKNAYELTYMGDYLTLNAPENSILATSYYYSRHGS